MSKACANSTGVNPSVIILLLAVALAMGSIARGESPIATTDPMKDAELRKRQEKPLFSGIASLSSESKPERVPPETSDYIHFDGFCTFLPKKAIIHVPDHLSSHVVSNPKGRIVEWQVFYRKNLNRVKSLEISLHEAAGKQPIAKRKLDSTSGSAQIVVAVLRGSPVSLNTVSPETK